MPDLLLSAILLVGAANGATPAPGFTVDHDFLQFVYVNSTARRVGMRMSLDGYRQIFHPTRASAGRYVFEFPLTGQRGDALHIDAGDFGYVFVVDGLNIADPANPARRRTNLGTFVSIATLPTNLYDRYRSPQRRPNGEYAFVLYGNFSTPPRLTGTFNEWNPDELVLHEVSPNLWAVHLRLPHGRYEYQFIVNQVAMEDPLNGRVVRDALGNRSSVLEVE